MKIVSSNGQSPAHLKLLFWGDTSTRKTESILRYFPDVLVIDTEGNAEQCFGMPDIPEFLLARTKDINEAIAIVDEVYAGKVKFPDGRPVQTLAIDSATILWTIRKDARSIVAEQRNAKWGKSPEEASMTQLDWSMAKRPIVRLMTRAANSPVKFLIFTARQSDKFEEQTDKKAEPKKIGVKPDAIKGMEYDMNLALQMVNDGNEWACVVTKVQGGLGRELPKGKRMTTFPAATILKHAGAIKPETRSDSGEDELASRDAEREAADTVKEPTVVTQTVAARVASGTTKIETIDDLYDAALKIGYATPDGQPNRQLVREALKAAGYSAFNAANGQKMLDALKAAFEKNKADFAAELQS